MNDMRDVIVPRSDQLNSDDLLSGPMTIKITGVSIKGGTEQPIAISFEGDSGKPYKPCKSMCRVMVNAWGADSKKYTGRSLKLFREPTVKWAGMEVGGIQISHMSDIDSAITMALTMTRANKKPFTVRPIQKTKDSAAPPAHSEASGEVRKDSASQPATAEDPFVVELLITSGQEWAEKGTDAYSAWWSGLLPADRKAIGAVKHAQMKAIAAATGEPAI